MVRSCMSDWLDLNGLRHRSLSRLLRQISANASHLSGASAGKRIPLTSDEAWQISASALSAYLPQAAVVADNIRANAPRDLKPSPNKHDRPYTQDRGPGQLPYVSCHYEGTPADFLAVAHEFAHAIQIAASERSVMPPLAREVCAFLGEHALLAHVAVNFPDLHPGLHEAMRRDDAIYFGGDRDALLGALSSQVSEYDYRWNYPVARHVARQVFDQWGHEAIWRLFSAGANAPAILELETVSDQSRPKSSLPALADDDPEKSAVNAYRRLGAMVLLETLGIARGGERKPLHSTTERSRSTCARTPFCWPWTPKGGLSAMPAGRQAPATPRLILSPG